MKLNIIKLGGRVLDDSSEMNAVVKSVVSMNTPVILIHGGGAQATDLANQLGVETQMKEGRRITSASMMKIVTMVYAGYLNKNLVARLQASGCNALGLTGADANIIRAVKRPVKEIDYGFAGDITGIDILRLHEWIQSGITPVFAAITHDQQGNLLNTNADTIAAFMASAMSQLYQVSLYMLFDKPGILEDPNDTGSVISCMNRETYRHLKTEGIVSGGILPKLENCFKVLESGVTTVHLGDTRMLASLETLHTRLTL